MDIILLKKKYLKCLITYLNIMKIEIEKQNKPLLLGIFTPQKARNIEEYLSYKQKSRFFQLPIAAPSFNGDVVDVYLKMGIGFQRKHGWRYYSIILPSGWEICNSRYDNWRHLIDENKIVRAKIHFSDVEKPKFANIYFKSRYYISETYDDFNLETNTFNKRYCVKDSKYNAIIFRTDATNKFEDNDLVAECNDYLNFHFPNYEDSTYYWDTEDSNTNGLEQTEARGQNI